MICKDPHSFSNFNEILIKHSELNLNVDFDSKVIRGYVCHHIDNYTGTSKLILDTRNININRVVVDNKEINSYEIGEEKSFLGSPLQIPVDKASRYVKIYYSTSSEAAALQWLEPQASDKYPFLFTQSEAILARTWVPCQDSPSVRFTYQAEVKVPSELLAVMSASNPQYKSPDGIYHFKMEQAIPSYLLALAVGNLEFSGISDRCGVYAEPDVVRSAAYEFESMEKMLAAAESLYGAYRWERFDVLVLPPSFPFGGMENPRLTFATPTILAGDRSLVSLVAHELAHSWSGNLVTNASWNDFWLNEGFTVYFERRIMEKLESSDYSDMLSLLGFQDLMDTMNSLGKENPDTCLKLNLEGRDPDDGMTYIAYEKGYFFLLAVERLIGRELWDKFLNRYFNDHAFQSMNTEEFIRIFDDELLDEKTKAALNLDEWIYKPGIPDNCPVIISERFAKVDDFIVKWSSDNNLDTKETSLWSTHEWLHFLRGLPEGLSVNEMERLESIFGFSKSRNNEILSAWLLHVINNKFEIQYSLVDKFLCNVGRRKFLMPLYNALIKTKEGRKLALRIYRKARPGYHYVSYSSLDKLLDF